jgi:regulator of sirC expression with transglutaminase-like and TPR domain
VNLDKYNARLLSAVVFCLISASRLLANARGALDDQTLSALSVLKEKQTPLFRVISALSEKAEKDLYGKSSDPQVREKILKAIVRDVRKQAGKNPDRKNLLAALNATLFDKYHFRAEPSPLFKNPIETTLFGPVFERHQGNCFTLSLIYFSLAERLHLSLEGVMVPNHFFLRYYDGQSYRNIESTAQGRELPDDYYRQEYYRRPDPPELKALTKKQIIAVYLNNLANHYKLHGSYERAIAILKTAMEIFPDQPTFIVNLGNVYERSGKISQAAIEYEKAIAIDPYLCEAYYNLGLLHFLYTHNYTLAERYGKVARKLGCRLHPDFEAFLNKR